jgi:hypothetical protein
MQASSILQYSPVTEVTVPRPFARHSFNQLALIEARRAKGTTLKIIVLGCVLVAVAITLKVRLDTPQGPQPLARAIVTTHLQKLRSDLALP